MPIGDLKPHSLTESRHRISLRSMLGLQEWEADMQAAEPKLFALSAHFSFHTASDHYPALASPVGVAVFDL